MNEGIDFSDIRELGDEFFANARRRGPLVQKYTVLVDRDIYEWLEDNFSARESTQLVDEILRKYMEEHRAKSASGDASLG